MEFLAPILNPAPYHIIFYGTLLGSSIFHSFVGGIIQFRVLPRPQFSLLQQSQIPVLFGMQTVLPALLILTYPRQPGSAGSFPAMDGGNKWGAFLPLVAMGLCGAINWFGLGPISAAVRKKRDEQETKDGKKYYEPGPHSEGMKMLNKRFGMLHGLSSLVNLIEILVTIAYGVVLSNRLQ